MGHDGQKGAGSARAVSRRAFLGMAGAATLAAGTGLAGCAPSASVSTSALEATSMGTTGTENIAAGDTSTPAFLQIPAAIPEGSLKETIEAEVVIIGAGLAGLSVARAAAEGGAGRIVVIEKAADFQCRSNWFGTVGSSLQADLGIPFDKGRIVAELMKTSGYRASARIIRLWAEHSGEAFDWFLKPCEGDYTVQSAGEPYDGKSLSVRQMHWPPTSDADDTQEYYPLFRTGQVVLPDMAPYLKRTYQLCQDAQVDFRFSNWARQLIRDNDGTGRTGAVIMEGIEGGFRKVVASKAIVLATGDYSSNEEMMQYYTRWATGLGSAFPNTDAKDAKTNTGDGHRMAMWAGGRMEDGPHAPMSYQVGGPLGVDGFLMVDNRGNRFANEDVGNQMLQNQLMHLPGNAAWQIFDAKWPEQIGRMSFGSANVTTFLEAPGVPPDGALGKSPFIAHEGSADKNTPGFDSYFAEGAQGVSSTGVSGLAAAMKVDAASLEATVARYNALAANGADEDFNKRADRLFALDTPPYYAYPLSASPLLCCMGGLVTDAEFRVLDAETDSPIGGLFAVGNVQGGRFLSCFPTAAPGISHGMALTHGMLLGRALSQKK